MKEWTGCLALIVGAIVMMILGGVIAFGLGWFGGMILEWICGEHVANGLNMVLGNITNHKFSPNDIPLFCAIMTTIGNFFKSTNYKSTTTN